MEGKFMVDANGFSFWQSQNQSTKTI